MNRFSFASLVSKTYERIVYYVDNAIASSIAFALTILAVYLQFVVPFFSETVIKDSDLTTIGNFIEWFGVPYGLLLALVLVNVWTQFDTTDRSFDREADAIASLYNTFLLVSTSNAKIKKYITISLYYYAKHVRECSPDEHKNRILKNKGDKLLNNIRRYLGVLIVQNQEHDGLATELLRLLNEVVDDRGDRLSYSKQRMPRSVLILSVISSILWLIPFFALNFSDQLIKVIYIGGVTFVVTSLLLIVWDLDEPFSGTWSINFESWDELLKNIKISK